MEKIASDEEKEREGETEDWVYVCKKVNLRMAYSHSIPNGGEKLLEFPIPGFNESSSYIVRVFKYHM